MTMGAKSKYRIAFVHPDLGLGGAERLIVDAALETIKHGHHCDVYTAYYDSNRCFEETKTGGFAVYVAGGWFPRHLFGKFYAFCAYMRCLLVALYVALQYNKNYDIIFVDQVSVVIPVLKAFTSAKVLFYCHFPDMLLAQRSSPIRKLYRLPLDTLEQTTTGMADTLLVNSRFTAGVFASTFTRLAGRSVRPEVLYPAVAIPPKNVLLEASSAWKSELPSNLTTLINGGPTFLSINRFERKKGLELAVQALHEHLQQQPGSIARLILAGGYDKRLPENVQVFAEMEQHAQDLGIADRVALLPSFTDRQRNLLLAACSAVIYTPQNEHFGIVPLEAMAAGKPVIACNSGGPVESVADGQTGFLRDPTPAAFAAAMGQLLEPGVAARMGAAARKHVESKFSRQSFGNKLDEYYQALVQRG